ncbi:uncharacterized protein EI90DRAFT_280809 [Cantharellus anzutake]|uniref:uncharacterized protein n=1 Tax=Cantharellus anzutake TaxID=1750568 RepID=UPI001902CC3B|nr:uncharacterized protein EI90DRAFT_280809 [Cantharellus anzutake]KAF8335944.1 hypothetical protein EI90DRAFT_280809 [Cantharellus anzutake]
MERSELAFIRFLPSSTMEAGIASPTLSMPGAFWPSQSRRPVRLSLSTNQPSASPRPLSTLSTLSTDSAYYSPQDGSFSPVSAYPNRPFSAIDAENDPLHSDFMTLENLRRDVRTNLRLRPLSSQPRCHTPGTDSVDYTTAPNSPLSAPFSPSAFSAEPSIAPPQVLLENVTPIRPSDTNIHFMPIEPSELASMLATSAESDTLIIDTRLPLNHSLLRIRGSINLAIPTLMLKRFRKAGSLSSLDILNPYIGESSRKNWDTKVAVRGKVRWPGDIIIIDEEMNSVDAHAARYGAANVGQNAPPNAASTLLCTLHPLCRGRVLFVQVPMMLVPLTIVPMYRYFCHTSVTSPLHFRPLYLPLMLFPSHLRQHQERKCIKGPQACLVLRQRPVTLLANHCHISNPDLLHQPRPQPRRRHPHNHPLPHPPLKSFLGHHLHPPPVQPFLDPTVHRSQTVVDDQRSA